MGSYGCRNCRTVYDTPEEAIECCQCENCAKLQAQLAEAQEKITEIPTICRKYEAQLAEIHLGYGMRSRKAMHDEIAELKKQLEAVRKTANEYIAPSDKFGVSEWAEAQNAVAENILEVIGEGE